MIVPVPLPTPQQIDYATPMPRRERPWLLVLIVAFAVGGALLVLASLFVVRPVATPAVITAPVLTRPPSPTGSATSVASELPAGGATLAFAVGQPQALAGGRLILSVIAVDTDRVTFDVTNVRPPETLISRQTLSPGAELPFTSPDGGGTIYLRLVGFEKTEYGTDAARFNVSGAPTAAATPAE